MSVGLCVYMCVRKRREGSMEGGRCVSAECRFYSPWKLEDDREVGIGLSFSFF